MIWRHRTSDWALKNGGRERQCNRSGVAALVIPLRVYADQIRTRYGTKAVRIREMLRYAKELGLKARAPRQGGSGLPAG